MIEIDWNPEEKVLRQFGFIALFGFPLMGLALWWLSGAPILLLYIFIGLGIASLLLGLVVPIALKPVFLGLSLIALPIGFVISFILLGLIYYSIFLIVGVFFRLTGKDPLTKGPDPSLESYWIERKGSTSPASYLRLY
ncbi:MAG: SxtJ family membrane protein [Planctomycetota bacterium]|jgi:hypothetical protein